jgi:hypothetical protein
MARSAALQINKFIDIKHELAKRLPKYKPKDRAPTANAYPPLDYARPRSMKMLGCFGNLKVERDLAHWRNVKKWPEYRETPGPQHDYQKVALSARATEPSSESFMFKSKVSNCQKYIPTDSCTFNGQAIDRIPRLKSEVDK